MPPQSIKLHRDELYDLVWSKPLSQLAQSYQISDVGLKKICKRLNVPTPPRGYWAKLQHGHPVQRAPLPAHQKDAPVSHTLYLAPDEPEEADAVSSPPTPRETLQITHPIKVPARLRDPHPLVRATQIALKNARPDTHERIHTYKEGTLDVNIHPSSVNRALRILHTVVTAAERLGFEVAIQKGYGPRDQRTCLVIRGKPIAFRIMEKVLRDKAEPVVKKNPWDRQHWTYSPTGILRLELRNAYSYSGRKAWSDTESQTLEEFIPSFLSGAFDAALAAIERDREREEERRREEEAERLRHEQEQRRREEQERRRALEQQAAQWATSRQVTAYIAEVERRAAERDLTEDQRRRFEKWLTWARAHAERLNPLSSGLPFEGDPETQSE